ncbi:hypothetical protein [Methylococcus sp. EFPC2]|uniref:hypothetical protein n=1 Tax=Methylococcus sp. EFPC2 TaxID=2812648 RepID=UPI001968644C|nr:hypothetical protein [Methylococcus sp. EFPC2]QSA98730.1 hypothetical protein JWZ97_08085 [Methylococcus sp. EFPC2]
MIESIDFNIRMMLETNECVPTLSFVDPDGRRQQVWQGDPCADVRTASEALCLALRKITNAIRAQRGPVH